MPAASALVWEIPASRALVRCAATLQLLEFYDERSSCEMYEFLVRGGFFPRDERAQIFSSSGMHVPMLRVLARKIVNALNCVEGDDYEQRFRCLVLQCTVEQVLSTCPD